MLVKNISNNLPERQVETYPATIFCKTYLIFAFQYEHIRHPSERNAQMDDFGFARLARYISQMNNL